MPLFPNGSDTAWSPANQRAAFLVFPGFLKGNLGGPTPLRVDTTRANQGILLQAITDFALPDRVIREDALATGLSDITKEAGVTGPPAQSEFSASTPFALADVRDAALDGATRASDQRDFMTFGFDRWEPPQAA
ncbi:hypothetical protein [uncultured Boseongicola sp.]|uniref:hypothetical protein n=1 Tax=uncultured Boseongicola sp. TaxID=1648499 RepID=UPI002610A115|nr:hypothetical protein [uncultured Boseongicola sp.]